MAAQDHFPKTITDLLLKSKTAAKEQNYDVALRAVNEGLKIADKNKLTTLQVISLLDYRYAVHVRNEDLDSALKDAKSMVRLNRKDARGYIRCGNVETLKDQTSAALKYFEHGLRSIPDSDPNMALLTSEMKKAQDQMAADLVISQAKDPMTTLPLEVIEFILSCLDYKQHVRLLGVSRSWKRVLSGMPPLTDTLAFPRAKKPITPKMLLAALRRLKTPKVLRAAGLAQPAANILMDRLRNSQAFIFLQSFEIDDPHFSLHLFPLKQWDSLRTVSIGIATSCNLSEIPRLLEVCPNLEVARFQNVDGRCRSLSLCSQTLRELEILRRGDNTLFVSS